MDVSAKVGHGKLVTILATSGLSFVLPSSAAFYKGGPMRRLTAVGLLVLISVAGFGIAQSAGGRGPSTPEERSRFVAIPHKLENDPLDRSLDGDRDWALRWLIAVPDVHVSLCSAVLGDFMKEKKYKYSGEIMRQLTFSAAPSTMEDPAGGNDPMAQHVAGVKGALTAYQSILTAKPEAHSKSLDALVQQQSNGKLEDTIRASAKKACQ